jgi:protein-S-isoprenylcysteine O-methyltransferase Ste14
VLAQEQEQIITLGLLAYSALLFPVLLLVDAPYGRRDRAGWGPAIPVRTAWCLMELPSLLVPLWVLYNAGRWPAAAGLVLLLLWLAHYAYRSLIYPLRLRSRPGASFKLVMLLLGAPVNALIGYLIARMALGEIHLQQAAWLLDPRFALGLALFVVGVLINRRADATLRRLRASGGGYAIPRGGLYERISCPNYFGELLQWLGFAVASWSLAGFTFFIYCCANLVPRAIASHRWYRQRFPDYPAQRRALLPGLL